MMRKLVNSVLARFTNSYGKISYSQTGEDLIIDHLMRDLKIENPQYLDIGANHPIVLSNTYIFYKRGCRGVCIEPDPKLIAQLMKVRPLDQCLNIGIGLDNRIKNKAKFFIMTSNVLNTFSEERANSYVNDGCYGEQEIKEIIEIELVPINEIIKRYFNPHPNIISLDVEGWELDILNTLDFKIYRPDVFCIETASFTENKVFEKNMEIISYMRSQGYLLYADTFLNSIFVEKATWENQIRT